MKILKITAGNPFPAVFYFENNFSQKVFTNIYTCTQIEFSV